ncbi:MAG: Folate-dependent protein for Fe/S cluster synthesis/repair in oxidative stress [Gammaproteobacteria bacterium]|jgi:folate-binding protein YgfZ|nr:Folate-dependent protein for Fe/S cluster synthesis/repair in oxidative stress [Gammaproteobacteria bacterium]
MHNAPEVITLDDLGIVRVRGVDAVRFLQGQLSNDVARLGAENSILAGYHNPQGRTIALLRLVQWDADGAASGPAAPGDILAVVPRELAGVVASRLGKFVLRAKVKVADESAGWRVSGLVDVAAEAVARGGANTGGTADAGGGANTGGTAGAGGLANTVGTADTSGGASARGPALSELPSVVGAQTRSGGAVFVRVGDDPPRWLVISPADAPAPLTGHAVGDRQTWLRLDIAAGLPQVYAATSEEFVAQMLNLDVLNAIAFDKGCYTGQEVIARAHYRGRVKRRMQRFVSRDTCHLAPADSGQLADGRSFKVVLATQLADGRCDFLAVAPLVSAGHDGAAATGSAAPVVADPAPTAAPTMAPAAGAPVAATVAADQVPLPYSLPD